MDKNKEITLSVLIINFGNTKDYLRKCLDSISKAAKKQSTEIIVIDNISTDGTREMVKNKYPEVIYIRKEEAHNFGENNNIGIKASRGKYLLFLNSDTELVDENTFKEMTDFLDKNPSAGAATCSLINSDRKTIQGTGGSFPDLLRVFLWMTFIDDLPFVDRLVKPFHPMHNVSPFGNNSQYYQNMHEQDWITGAFYMVKRETLDKSGIFDEEYNAYVEEVDLSYRIKKAGYKIWYLPKWKVVHHGGVSYGNENSFIFELKNLKLFYKKHYPSWQFPVLEFIIKLGCLLRIIIFGLINPKLSKIYAKAIKTI